MNNSVIEYGNNIFNLVFNQVVIPDGFYGEIWASYDSYVRNSNLRIVWYGMAISVIIVKYVSSGCSSNGYFHCQNTDFRWCYRWIRFQSLFNYRILPCQITRILNIFKSVCWQARSMLKPLLWVDVLPRNRKRSAT